LKALLAEINTPLIVTTDFRNFTDVEANLRLIGQAVGEESRAEAVIAEMRQKLVAARAPATGRRGAANALFRSRKFQRGRGHFDS